MIDKNLDILNMLLAICRNNLWFNHSETKKNGIFETQILRIY